ncbi:hypothetical protein [Pseudoalteromonas sp. SK18]|uniref:hypothetical protein n=1 Tax=Pseudoalteromonas sp. SK18 TaxID=1938366 RepID=UPI0009760D1B|nr:hypothetical protein [Pseudoalteromonas sp. SK18]
MGIRLAMKKELMGLEHSDLLTADDVRAHLAQQVKEDTERGFSVISKFNDTHSQLVSGLNTKQSELEFERHRLFNEVLYKRQSVDAWLNNQSSG